MNEGQTKTANNDSDDMTLCSMLHDFYNRKMLSIVAVVWIWAIIFIGGAVYSAIEFFKSDLIKDQIMFAAIFVCCFQGLGLIKIFAWHMIHRKAINRHIRRLERRIAEFTETTKGK